MVRVLVTGGSGNFGRFCCRHLLQAGWDVVSADQRDGEVPGVRFVRADLTQLGQVVEALRYIDWQYEGVDAIVHLGAIPAPGITTSSATFDNNIRATHNVFLGAKLTGIKRVVWASSETVLGIPFDIPPAQVPIDESIPPRPESAYALVKTLEEQMASHFTRWDPELTMVGLRFSNIIDPAQYVDFAAFQGDPSQRRWNLWGYVDARDAAQAVERSLVVERAGASVYIVAAADTVMPQRNHELLATEFPGVPIASEIGEHDSLLSIEKARRELGYEPLFSWRQNGTDV